jgi:antibiotic biosynthesis monooxygenase (ABM) superfamily enzyme
MALEGVEDNVSAIELPDIELGQHIIETPRKEAQGSTGTYSAVIEIIVPLKHRKYFADEWNALIYNRVSTYKGFRTRHVHLLNEKDGFLEYMTVLVFDDFESFSFWQLSDDRQKLIALLKPRGITAMLVNAYGGCGNGDVNEGCTTPGPEGGALGARTTTAGTGRVMSQNALTGKIPRPMPPPKWKLYMILLGTVFACLSVIGEGSMTVALLKANQPAGFTLLLGIMVVVTGMTYSFLPLLMGIPIISKWLRTPRSVQVEDMHPVHAMLDQGLLIFAEETHQPQVPIAVLDRLSKLEVKCDRLRSANHELRQRISSIEDTRRRASSNPSMVGDGDTTASVDPAEMVDGYAADEFSSNILAFGEHSLDSNVPITMAVRHHVKWECVLDFEKWTDEIVSVIWL